MIAKVFNVLLFVTNRAMLRRFYVMTRRGYLFDRGWIKSALTKSPVDKTGEPIPWITLSFLDFLKPRLREDLRLFEYGSGNSTLFYARHVKEVCAVESDLGWYNRVGSKIPSNVKLIYVPGDQKDRYCACPKEFETGFDIIVVDGHSRVDCVQRGILSLSQCGVIILDNSNRPEYKLIYSFLSQHDFRCLDFWGMAAGSVRENCTTVFYRHNNCLNI